MRIDPTVTKRTTHLVSLEPRRTLNMLRGLMRGVWILNFKWILDSMEANKWLPEEKYELTSFSRSIEVSLNKLLHIQNTQLSYVPPDLPHRTTSFWRILSV